MQGSRSKAERVAARSHAADLGTSGERHARRSHGTSLALLVLLIAVLAGAFIDRDLVNSLETGYALTVQETVRDHHWIVPTQNGEPRLKKPPLPFWIGAGACELLSLSDAPVPVLRGVSALLAVLGGACVYLLGCDLFGRRAGLWSALIWATSFATVYELRYARHDIYLTAFVALSMLGAWRVLEGRRGGWPLTLIGLVLAFQAKGPVSWALTVLPLVAYVGLYLRRRWRVLPGVFACMLLAALSLLPWLLAMQAAIPVDLVPVYAHEAVLRFHSDRVTGTSPFYYLGFVGFVFPWVAFLAPALASPFRRDVPQRQRRAYPWLWLVVGLGFLCLAKEKHTRYAVPLMAPAALLMGDVLERSVRAGVAGLRGRPRPWKAHALLLVLAGVGVPVGLAVAGLVSPGVAVGCGLPLVALALWIARCVQREELAGAAAWTPVFAVCALLTFLGAKATAPSYGEPLRELAVQVREIVEGRPVFTWPDESPPHALTYYAGFVAPAIADPLNLVVGRPDLPDVQERYDGDPAEREALFQEVLADHLEAQDEDVLYAICEPRRLPELEEVAGSCGFTSRTVLDLTTRRPRRRDPREALELIELTRSEELGLAEPRAGQGPRHPMVSVRTRRP